MTMTMAMAMARTMSTTMTTRFSTLWSRLEQQESPAASSSSSGGGIQDDHDRPAAYYYPPPPPFNSGSAACDIDSRPADCPLKKYESMGLLRPWRLPLEFFEDLGSMYSDSYDDSNKSHDYHPSVYSDEIRRWWEGNFKKPWKLPPSGTSGIPEDDRPAPQLSMLGSNSNWEGWLKRAKLGHTFGPYPNYSVQDVVAIRVLGVTDYFTVEEDPYESWIYLVEPEQFEYWLDELQGYVEFMELAHELHSIDCLFPLLHHVLVHPRAACIRAKTAELVTTMVHNNPRSQQLVMRLHGLRQLWHNFTSDPDATSRTKALGAVSALIRNNKPGVTKLREMNGYAALRDALSTENVWLQREALNLIQYLLHEKSSDCSTVTELGIPHIMMHLASSDDAEVRVAALRGLLVLARDEGGNCGQLVKNDDKLKQVLEELIKRISAMATEDLVAAREEIQLVDSLWNACYNEPSPIAWAAVDRKLPIETLLYWCKKRMLHFF